MQMKLKEIGVSVLETTSAGSIASVASSLFTPTSDGQPAVIRRTKKKQNKNPSIYEGDMEADREAGIKWVDDPNWKQLHNMDVEMVKDFLEHKEGISETTMQRQHFEVIADIIGSFPGHAKIRMDFMTHAMDKLREINPQFKDSTFVARVRKAIVDQKDQEPQEPDDKGVAEKAPPGREKQVKALKGKVDNPYAVAWNSYNKGKK